MDSSGWLPEALDFLLDITTHLPPGVAEGRCHKAGYAVSRAELDRLISQFGQTVRQDRHEVLAQRAFDPLSAPVGDGRIMVAQLDGCFVLGQPEDGKCGGVEVKNMVVYPQLAPQQRSMHADVCPIAEFQPVCAGLLREAGVRENDVLVGLGDGAAWVTQTLRLLGAHLVLDVFHATQYVEKVMVELGWSEELREEERKCWLRGTIDGEEWVKTFIPKEADRTHWSDTGCVAARYLAERVEQMHYPLYRERGWPIGSGQIEGANKSVIGHRLKRAGQHWSRPGAGGMAAVRARAHSVSCPLSFHTLRQRAFPTPHF